MIAPTRISNSNNNRPKKIEQKKTPKRERDDVGIDKK